VEQNERLSLPLLDVMQFHTSNKKSLLALHFDQRLAQRAAKRANEIEQFS